MKERKEESQQTEEQWKKIFIPPGMLFRVAVR